MEYLTEALSGIAILISSFALKASNRSAKAAETAQTSAENAAHRASLQEISFIANRILFEERTVQSIGVEVKRALRTLANFQNNVSNTRFELKTDETDKKINEANAIANQAKLFADGAKNLQLSTNDDVDRVLNAQIKALNTVQAICEELKRTKISVDSEIQDCKPTI